MQTTNQEQGSEPKTSETTPQPANLPTTPSTSETPATPAASAPISGAINTAQEQAKNIAGGIQNLGKSLIGGSAKQLQPQVKQDEKVYAAVAYLPLVAIMCIMFKPDSSFVRMHARQGLMVFILFFITLILTAVVATFPVIGPILGFLFGLIPFVLMLVAIYSMYLALTGFWWKIPLIGQMAEIIPVEALAKVSKENLTGQVNIAKEDYDSRQAALKKEEAEKKATEPASQTKSTTDQPESK